MTTHTDPGWWLVWMLYGVLITIAIQGIFQHRKFNKTMRELKRTNNEARGALDTLNAMLDSQSDDDDDEAPGGQR